LHIDHVNECWHFTIAPEKSFDDLKVDDSISVNGVCLTVTGRQDHCLEVTAVPETLRLTNLKFLSPNSRVNLERAMRLQDRISGHCMQGHVDACADILDIYHEGAALLVKVATPPVLANYIVNKGYIALDGMSITVIHADKHAFTVTLIPHTQKITIASEYSIGTAINIEVDVTGKYIEKMLRAYQTC